MRVRLSVLVGVLLVATACGTGDDPAAVAGEGLSVVTTVSPITNIAANITGDLADIEGVIPQGEDSHEFEPAPRLARVLAEADVIFVNGLELETPTIELARANLKEGAEIVELGPRTIEPDEYVYDFAFPRAEGNPNPHLWTHPRYALRYAEIIRDVVSERDPGNAEAYQRNFDLFSERVEVLDEAIREATETIPEHGRKLLTYHDSFPYFARDYGWTIIGAIQPSDFSEPSPREVARIIDQIREEDVPAIFGSEVFPSPVLEQIAREGGARYVADLRDDDLPGDPGDDEHTWLGLMVFNLVTITEALGGEASAFDRVDVTNVSPDAATYA